MTRPEKAAEEGEDRLQAILPNPFIVIESAPKEPLPAASVSQTVGAEGIPTQYLQDQSLQLVLEEKTQGLLGAYLPDFGSSLPKSIPILDCYDDPQALPDAEPQSAKRELNDFVVSLPRAAPQLRGIGLIGAVFNELSKRLGSEFSTAELMLAAQQLIDVSKAEYVGIPYKDVAERAGYYSWDLVRAFRSHQWQIAEMETNRMDHCDIDEFAPESYEAAKFILQGRNERTWEF